MNRIIRQIINRDCHVSMTNKAVIKHVISRLKDGFNTYRKLPRADRREFMRQCIKQHEENREFYAFVMGPH